MPDGGTRLASVPVRTHAPHGAIIDLTEVPTTVLRIRKVAESPSETTLHVEGRIVSEWVSVLEDECRDALRAAERVRLDLSGVTFVDPRGVRLLRHLAGEPVTIVNCAEFVDALLKGDVG